MEDGEEFEHSEAEDDYDEEDSEEGTEEWVEDEWDSERPCTEEEYREELHFALTNAERPGSFCAEGTLKNFHHPGLEVARLGPIGLPLTEFQAKELARVCSQAPFGRREATLYDTSVRRCLQLSPDQFRLQGPDWTAQIQRLVNLEIRRGLGIPEHVKVVPQLYKLLLYEPGGFFKAHTDSEKEDGMFGTLAVVLPSVHKGGELVVRHGGREEALNFASRCAYHVHWAAFYADCEHQVLPIKEGHRLVLVYNLVAHGGSAGELAPADNRLAVQQALVALRAWSNNEDGPSKLVIPLEHRYSSKSLTFSGLKGPDVTTMDILRQASKVPDRAPFHFFLGMLKLSESGPEDFSGDSDTTLQLTDIIAPPGEIVRYSKLDCDENELVPEDALDDHEWDSEKSIDTGNEGVTVERWYRHAALILWPHSKHWEVACASNVGKAIKEATDLVSTANQVQEALEDAIGAGGHVSRSEAALVVDLVVEHGGLDVLTELECALHTICMHGGRLTSSQTKSLTQLLLKHGTAEMAGALILNCLGTADSQLIPTLASRFGWGALSNDILALLTRKCDSGSLTDCFNLLLRIAPKATLPPALEKDVADRGEGHVAEATNKEAEQSRKGSGSRHEAELGSCTSGPAPVSTWIAAERRTSQREKASGSGAPLQDPFEDAIAARSPPKQTAKEQERGEVCQASIATFVERISSRASSYSPSCSLNSHNLGPLVRLIERFGAAALAPATDALVRKTISGSLRLAAELLWDFVRVGHAKRPKGALPDLSPSTFTFYRQFALALVEQFKREPEDLPYIPTPRSSEFVALFFKTLHSLKLDCTVLDSVVAHFLVTPTMHPIPGTLLPALKELLAWCGEGPLNTPWFLKLLGGCLEALDRDCAEAPPEPKNWSLSVASVCLCGLCGALLKFCNDPNRTVMEITPYGGLQEHLEETIRRNSMPLRMSKANLPNAPLLCIKEGSEGLSDETELMLLLTRRETYQQN